MATVRALSHGQTGDMSLIQDSWRKCFFCCLNQGGSSTPDTTRRRPSDHQPLHESLSEPDTLLYSREDVTIESLPNGLPQGSKTYGSVTSIATTTASCRSHKSTGKSDVVGSADSLGTSSKKSEQDTVGKKKEKKKRLGSAQHLDGTDAAPRTDGADNGSSYTYGNGESSSDSDEDVLRNFQQSQKSGDGSIDARPKSDVDTSDPERGKGSSRGVSNAAFTSEATSISTADTAQSAYGGLTQNEEHLFDVSDLNEREEALISKCGSLEVTFDYDLANGKMLVAVHQARDIPSKDRGGASSTQVRLLLLPGKKSRCKTKIKTGESPQYQETFTFKVPFEEINSMGVRFRVYGCERMRRERMIGETVIGFSSISHDTASTHWLVLEPRSNISHGDSRSELNSLERSDSASSTQSMQHGGVPELLLGLSYNGTTGRLSVEIIKGSNFKNLAMSGPPDTYVKMTLMSPTGQEITRSKTSTRRGQPNPLYKETSVFQVALFQLPEVTLMMSVYNKRSMKRKEMIGWFSLGFSNSSEEELAHWTDMRENKGEQVCRWHVLLEP